MRAVVVGGGVHGLSTAGALARGGAEVIVLEKGAVGAGASGIAGGIVRNYYRSEAMTEVIARSVEVFESEPDAFGFKPVGYLAVVPERQVDDLRAIAARQAEVGYASELALGADATELLRWHFPDWSARGVEAALFERRSGWADAMGTVRELAVRARAAGAEIREGVEAVGFESDASGSVTAVLVAGDSTCTHVSCDALVVAPGPWGRPMLDMLGVETDGLFTYVLAREGDFVLPGAGLGGRAGHEAPVVHLDSDLPLHSDRDGRLLTDEPWGIYFRMGRTGTGIAGGGLPLALPAGVAIDPYGHDNPEQIAGEDFAELFTSALATAMRRFRDAGERWQATPHGGVIALTPDGYPVCDRVRENVYAILDAGHGFKMLAIGGLVARELLEDRPQPLLEPFRMERFAAGTVHPASKSPYPWT
jgi:glycine/D-amino acid oxidase-like deaminating enzyme